VVKASRASGFTVSSARMIRHDALNSRSSRALTMANNWPGGGEPPLTRADMITMNVVAVVLVAIVACGLLLIALRVLGPVSWPVGVAAGGLALAGAVLWVQPWKTEVPPKRPGSQD